MFYRSLFVLFLLAIVLSVHLLVIVLSVHLLAIVLSVHLLAIVLSVHLRYTDSVYPSGIFKLLIIQNTVEPLLKGRLWEKEKVVF